MQLQQATDVTKAVPSRRIFLGSAVAIGMGSAVGGGVLLQQSTSAQTRTESDEVEAELHRQLQESVKAMRGPRRGEAARRAASTLHVTAAHYRSKDLDTAFKRHVRARIRREGKDAVLRTEMNPQVLEAMKAYGLTTLPSLRPLDDTLRERALKELLAGGITPVLLQGAAQLERLSVHLDDQPPVALVSARQCPDLSYQIRLIEIAMVTTCIFSGFGCVVISGMWVGLMLSLMYYGC